jgi:hypothetical protein
MGSVRVSDYAAVGNNAAVADWFSDGLFEE